jgi:hypothetical protein
MGAYELIKTLAVLGPIVALVGMGLVICARSGSSAAGEGTVPDLRRMAGNLSRALLMVGACLLGLAALQGLVGFPIDGLG